MSELQESLLALKVNVINALSVAASNGVVDQGVVADLTDRFEAIADKIAELEGIGEKGGEEAEEEIEEAKPAEEAA